MKPYSMYQYGQIDGRKTFSHNPINGKNYLLVNMLQFSINYPRNPLKCHCDLILMSYDPSVKLTFDARYIVPEYQDLIDTFKPLHIEVDGGIINIEELDAGQFSARY